MIGRQIGRYRITEELGRGGMGVVYRATQVTLNRTVAVKLLFPHLAGSGEYLARFRREAETLARLDHESIVRIFDIEEYEDTHCIIMEFVGGPSLSRVLAREGTLPPHRARAVAVDIASALCAAHRQGVIHRDIKPDNILFNADGRPKLTDFGIARIADGSPATRTGVMIGTPSYMSPEQAAGRPVTDASDLYSLGVVLFEMLSGRVPFIAGDPLAVALKHISEPPPSLRSLVPSLPAPLCDLVARTLAKDPGERFASALDLREALRDLALGGEEAEAPPEASRPEGPGGRCPECGLGLAADFLTCPRCGLSIRQRCSRCDRLYDPLSPECPFCRTPATPVPAFTPLATDVAAEGTPPTVAGPIPQTGGGPATERVAPHGAATRLGTPAGARPLRPVEAAVAGTAFGRPYAALAGALARHPGIARVLRRPAALWATAGVLAVALTLAVLQLSTGTPEAPRVDTDVAHPASAGGAGPAGLRDALGQNTPRRPLTPEEVAAIDRAAGDSSATSDTARKSPEGTAGGRRAREEREEPRPVADTAAADSVRAPSESPPAPPASSEEARNEEAARMAILAIVERQRRATEAGDLDLLLQDVAPELHEAVRTSFHEMARSAREIRSKVTRVGVELAGADSAKVAFHTLLTGVRIKDGRAVTIYDGQVVWRVERRAGRWLICEM
jgi:hypothetical protein